jgi:hypothetical protein
LNSKMSAKASASAMPNDPPPPPPPLAGGDGVAGGGLTVTLTAVGADRRCWLSAIVYVNWSVPEKPAFGV